MGSAKGHSLLHQPQEAYMGLSRPRLRRWLVIYESVSIAVSILAWFSSRGAPAESIAFIRARGALSAVLHIWLSNVSSFFIGAVLAVLHPALGVLAAAFASLGLGELLASWLAGYCSTPHLVYGVVETQAYILLWLLAARTYYVQRSCRSLLCRWRATLRETGRLLVYAFTVFLLLAVVEVLEVRAFG